MYKHSYRLYYLPYGPWGGDGGARGGMHDGAAAVRFRCTLMAGDGFVGTAGDRVPL